MSPTSVHSYQSFNELLEAALEMYGDGKSYLQLLDALNIVERNISLSLMESHRLKKSADGGIRSFEQYVRGLEDKFNKQREGAS